MENLELIKLAIDAKKMLMYLIHILGLELHFLLKQEKFLKVQILSALAME